MAGEFPVIDFEDDTIAYAVRSTSPADFVEALISNDFDDGRVNRFQFFQEVGRKIKQRRKIQPPCGHITVKGAPCSAQRLLGGDGCKHHIGKRTWQP